jgi:RNA polymerase sigma-70 factor (ECF subfamily)
MMAEPNQPRARHLPPHAVVGDSTPPPPRRSATVRIAGDDPRVPLATAGDRAATSSLLTELMPRTRNVVRFLVRGDADVDDFTQQALIEVMRSLRGFRGDSSLTTWADRITARTVLRQLGRQRREREQQNSMAPELRLLSTSPADAEGYAQRRQLAQVLDGVPDAQRQALVLHHVVGMSVPELAGELGVSFDTAKSRLRLGMERLRTHFGREGNDDG